MDLITISLLGNFVKPISEAEVPTKEGLGEFQVLLNELGLGLENSASGSGPEDVLLPGMKAMMSSNQEGIEELQEEGSGNEDRLPGSEFGIEDLSISQSGLDLEVGRSKIDPEVKLPIPTIPNHSRLPGEHRPGVNPVFPSFVLGGSRHDVIEEGPPVILPMKAMERSLAAPVQNLDEVSDSDASEAKLENLKSELMSQGSQADPEDTGRRMGKQMLDGKIRRDLLGEAKSSGISSEPESTTVKGLSLDPNSGKSSQTISSQTTQGVVPVIDPVLSLGSRFKIDGVGETKVSLPAELTEAKSIINQIAQKLVNSSSRNGMSIQFGLEPEWLGPLRVDLSIHQHKINARITTSNFYVRELVQVHQEMLRETLAEYGYRVDRFVVSVGESALPSSLSHEGSGQIESSSRY